MAVVADMNKRVLVKISGLPCGFPRSKDGNNRATCVAHRQSVGQEFLDYVIFYSSPYTSGLAPDVQEVLRHYVEALISKYAPPFLCHRVNILVSHVVD